MQLFKEQNILEIFNYLEQELKNSSQVSIETLNPDENKDAITLKSWADLAELLKCKLNIPKVNGNKVVLTFTKLEDSSFHNFSNIDKTEKYGVDSLFFKIDKTKLPYFSYHYRESLKFVNVASRKNILNLGVNRGDEFIFIKDLLGNEAFAKLNLTGIDHSKSAIEYAKNTLPNNCKFYTHDINAMQELNLPKQDLIISIGTLQSPQINYKLFLSELLKNYLKPNGALIIAFPNSRWQGNTNIYGARVKNYKFSELGLMLSDVIYTKKFLQQKKFKVVITGREYIFITATRD